MEKAEGTNASRGFSAGLKRLTRHSGVYAVGGAVNKAVGFVLIPLVTAYIGTLANYGVKEIAEVTLAVAAQILGINLLHGMTRFHADYESEEDRRKLVSTTALMLAASTGAAMLVGVFFAPTLARWLFGSEEYADAMRAVAAILFFNTLAQTGLRYLQILEQSQRYVIIQFVKLILEVGLKVFFLIALSMTYMGVILPVVIGEGILGLGALGFILWRERGAFSVPMAKRLIRYSWPLVISGLAMFILHQADRFVVNLYHGLGEVGLYGLAYKLGMMVNALLFDSFALIWFPFVFGIGDDERVKFTMRKVGSYFAFGTAFVSLGVALMSYEIVYFLADEKFRDASVTIPVIVLGYVLWSAYQITSTALYLKERTGLISIVTVLAALLNVGLNFAWVPEHGTIGAAWATVATFGALALGTWAVSERAFPVRYELVRVASPLLLAGALYWAGYSLIPDGSLAWTISCKTALWFSMPVILYVFGYFTAEERSRGFAFLKRRLGRILGSNRDS